MVPVFWLVVGLLLFAMCGCARVQYIPVETVRVDSVSVPVPVERKLSRWEETKLHYGGFALLAVVVCILIGFGRLVYRLKK